MSAVCALAEKESSGVGPPGAPVPAPNAVEFHYTQSDSFVAVLKQLAASLLVTTYQANKLLIVREAQGGLSTLVRTFDQPMGVAVDGRRLALGTRNQIWLLRNAPDIAPRIGPAGLHDGCFLPRSSHVTGDIRGHEIAWAGDELWIVNTRFSCLCTLDPDYSFVPRWRPPFISVLAAEDRCHLNGLAMVDAKPKYVSALGETDRGSGWRADKAKGGCLIDVPSREVVARGLSMPHSPRLHEGRLYLLESGTGRLLQVDTVTGRGETVAELAGFTRGLAIHGPYAFIGLSKIRETNTFGGLPIAERLEELKCGVAVVDLRRGQVVGLLEFQTAVEEIFAVEVLPGVRFPEVLGFQQETIQHTFIVPRDGQPVRTPEHA
jgi:uncharacterized protein (TIGR03032 family)